jgi:hypothetical protein
MPTFNVDREPINLFEIDDQYLFAHYFEREDVFDALSEYYNGDQYRFEVPLTDLDAVQATLDEHFYEPCIIKTADLAEYCVVKEQYTSHADILRNSVVHWSREEHNFFIMKDESAKREALEAEASPISDTEFVLGL